MRVCSAVSSSDEHQFGLSLTQEVSHMGGPELHPEVGVDAEEGLAHDYEH